MEQPHGPLTLRILTSCTGEKIHQPAHQLRQEDFRLSPEELASREQSLAEFLTPAGRLYSGQQHVRLMRGVEALRGRPGATVEVHVLSAGYGIVPESRPLAPYEVTFQGMGKTALRRWADHLQVPRQFRDWARQPADLILVLLGDHYLEACALDASVQFGGPALLFCGHGMARRLRVPPGVSVVPVGNADAKRFSCGLVGLKGELAARLGKGLAEGRFTLRDLLDPQSDVQRLLDQPVVAPVAPKGPIAKPGVDVVISIPQSWWDKPHRQKLRYFIPEWDDLVDPDYDFLMDTHSGGTSSWENEVYAHQMYPEPNYDGILMSRAIAEKSKAKRERINRLGVHRMLRVPRQFPIMGDCGAFDYIMEDVPPYTTADVLDYYTRLDFDYGVSVDHLIVTATEHQKKERYALTIHNAEEFLKEHRKAGLKWEPIGAVQGWDPKSYAAAAAQYVRMGYRYIGLGGLVRSSTGSILELLQAVKNVVSSNVKVHLFGLARLNAMKQLAQLGVTSVDSASALRQAWFGAKDNYWSQSGQHYRAIRIPKAERSFRAKNIVSDGRATGNYVMEAEKRSIEALRLYDKGNISVDELIKILEDFDHLITPDRPTFMEQYRKTLEDMPWKSCPCAICQKDGVEVIIFRGNDRNRRRGFHNTFVFHQMFQGILNGTMQPPAKARGGHTLQPELDLGI